MTKVMTKVVQLRGAAREILRGIERLEGAAIEQAHGTELLDPGSVTEIVDALESMLETARMLAPVAACTCFYHAPELHGPNGCTNLGCDCKWDGKLSEQQP